MSKRRRHSQADESIEDLAETARDENPDPITRREAFELELMDEGRSDEGVDVELSDPDSETPP